MQSNREEVIINIFKDTDNRLPAYAKEGDAGMDVMSAVDITIHAGETLLVPTNLYLGIPDGWEVQVRPRSGLSYKTKLRIANSTGTVDAPYKGNVQIIMDNIGKTDSFITKGERIAQIVAKRVPKIVWNVVQSVEELGTSERGASGFGASGSH